MREREPERGDSLLNCVIRVVPVADEKSEVTGGVGKRDRNARPAEDSHTSKTAGGFMEG